MVKGLDIFYQHIVASWRHMLTWICVNIGLGNGLPILILVSVTKWHKLRKSRNFGHLRQCFEIKCLYELLKLNLCSKVLSSRLTCIDTNCTHPHAKWTNVNYQIAIGISLFFIIAQLFETLLPNPELTKLLLKLCLNKSGIKIIDTYR